MFFSKNRRTIMNIVYSILGICYGYFACKCLLHYDIVSKNYTKIMLIAMLIFSFYYIGMFLYFRFISKSDFWEKRYFRTTLITMLSFIILVFYDLYVKNNSLSEAFDSFVQTLILCLLPSLVVWTIIFLLNNYKIKK